MGFKWGVAKGSSVSWVTKFKGDQNSECKLSTRKLEKAVVVRNSLSGKVSREITTLLENDSPIFRQHEMLSLPRFGHFPARKMAAGKSTPPSGTLLDFLL